MFFIQKRTIYIVLGIIILIPFIIKFFYNKNNIEEVSYLPITNRVIGIDPGHGGVDPGAVGTSGVVEDEINLQIALKLKRLIEQSGGIAIMTREADEGLYTDKSKTLGEKKSEDLKNRNLLIEDADCELFISIHLNSFTDPKYYGAQAFYMEEDEESLKLGEIVQKELKNTLDKENNRKPASRDDIYLLKNSNIPSLLVEVGFLSNPLEEKILQTEEYQEKIAWSIYTGIMKYLNDE
ncbi:MAG TPA: N-acetylmuramoyl-L-alanine amidase CwlD [Tissierellaceae bacterium]|nr:N-acetylmuramoyl-L-alanine amidase CwlD [Tissierellaceae bacterium]